MVDRVQKRDENVHRSVKIELRHVLEKPQDLLLFLFGPFPCAVEHRRGIIYSYRVESSVRKFTSHKSGTAAEVAKKGLAAFAVTFVLTALFCDPGHEIRPSGRIEVFLERIVISR